MASVHQDYDQDDEVNDNPIEEVRLTVSTTDDPTLPCMTFRTWTLGTLSCIVLSFANQFFAFRQNQLTIGAVCVQIMALPLGKFMAASLPEKSFRFPFTNWTFSLNPGPFNIKEHVLITIFANSGAGGVYGLNIVTIVKAFYHRSINIAAAFLLCHTTQLLGYGWAGLFRRYLVDSPYMWWPSSLIQVSLFSALHDEKKRPKGGMTRFQFFLVCLTCSFAYFIIPNYFFPSITALSVVCWIWKKSITAQQIGSGLNGLGVGAIGPDWSTISGFLGSPLASPGFAIINIAAGFIIYTYIMVPISYWNNMFNAKMFPIFDSSTFDSTGNLYNTSRVLDVKTFSLNLKEYESYSKIHLSIFFVYSYGLGFATLTATIAHVALFNGSTIVELWRKTASTAHDKFEDVHTRIMKKNYAPVPQWWFYVIMVIVLGLSFYTCEGFNKQFQLPYWGILLACAMAFFFTLPIGIIAATTNQVPGLNIITEMVIGFMYPGKPLANVVFKTYGYISMSQALTFLADFKLGHYMKIPPKSMFVAQLAGTLVANTVYFATGWYLLTSVPNICHKEMLPDGSPWTCPGDKVFYNASIIWGVVGPLRMFGRLGNYEVLNYFFLFGLLAPVPVWLASRAFPEKKWIQYINLPIVLGATSMMPPARAVNFTSWIIVGLIFNVWIYNRYKEWWARNNYVLSAGLDSGTAFMGILAYFTLGSYGIYSLEWWGGVTDDHCPLAVCPTIAGGFIPEGCPAIQ